MKNCDPIIDLKPIGEESSIKDVLRFGADILEGTVVGVVKGISGTAEDVLQGGVGICRGDFSKAADIVSKRAVGIVQGTIGAVCSGIAVGEAGYDSIVNDAPFITPSNRDHLTRLCQLGVYATTGGLLAEDAVPEGHACTNPGDACELPGVENGVFVGDEDELQQLIAVGEIQEAPLMESSEIERSAAERAAFLHAHGIEDTHGWEVHHVQPLAAGGADSADNMVLVSDEDHDRITAEHNRFYGWSRKA